MYIIRKTLKRIENGELVNAGYVRLKKCHTFGQVDYFMKGLPYGDLHNCSVTEYTCDPDIYPAVSKKVRDVHWEYWFLG